MNRIWHYEDQNGRLLGKVKRIDSPDGKRFVQYTSEGKPGGFGHPLYGLQRLQDRSRSVHLFEGEKCADAAYGAGLVALSTCGGAGAAHLTDIRPLDGFKLVVIHPDNDKPSRQRWAPALIKQLGKLRNPPRIMVCELPDLPAKGDVVDWIQQRLPKWDGFDLVNAPDLLKHQLREAIRTSAVPAEQWDNQNHAIEVIEGGWSEPEELPSLNPPVVPFDPELLPAKLRPWIMNGADNLNAPPDYLAVTAMVEMGSLIGRKVAMHPKRFEDWLVIPNLWGAIIGPPSARKSPSIKYALRPLRHLQKQAMEQHQEDERQHQRDMTLLTARIQQGKDDLKKALKDGDDALAEQITEEIGDLEEQAELPRPRQYYTSDATIEKMAVMLTENPNGLLQERDELIGWLRGMDRNGREQDRPFYLETWDGDGTYVVNRMGREPVHCEGMCLSVFGGMQPGPTSEYVADTLRGGVRDDGMMQRFQLVVWPDQGGEWVYTDKRLDPTDYKMAESVFRHLDALTPEEVGATIPEDGLPYLRFDEPAQALFIDWISQLNREKLRPDEHPAMQSHLTKYESLMPSLALILHLADGHTGAVGVEAAARAADWCEYLESHARRLYGSDVQEESRAARLLADKILNGKIEDGCPSHSIARNKWSGLGKSDSELALKVLEEHGWLRVERKPTKGRPAQIIRLNPKLATGT
jgi:putative DNA primase/helicase